MTLFKSGRFTSHAGLALLWKVECDTLDDDDWNTLAGIAARYMRFGLVEGVPSGGLRFAEALRQYSVEGAPLLIADDVLTTGGSMEELRAGREALGLVAFARGDVPPWVTAVWRFGL